MATILESKLAKSDYSLFFVALAFWKKIIFNSHSDF